MIDFILSPFGVWMLFLPVLAIVAIFLPSD